MYFFPYKADDEGEYGVVGTFSVSLMYLLLERGVLQMQGSNSSSGVVPFILLCNSELERELEAYVQYIFNNTFPLTSLRSLKLSCFFKKTRTPKKSQSDEVHSLSLPERPLKDTGLLK